MIRRLICWLRGHDPVEGGSYFTGPLSDGTIYFGKIHNVTCRRCDATLVSCHYAARAPRRRFA